MERRLAAILAADVVGYSKLMAEDEAGTLAAVSGIITKLVEPLVVKNNGRIVKLMGDGILAEFGSALDAVGCAILWQEKIDEIGRNIQFRIGINLGDIIIQDGDIFGNGVNVAARLEAIADPRCICVSDDIYRQVKGKVESKFHDMGLQQLKNVEDLVRVYQINAHANEQEVQKVDGDVFAVPDKPSIAVLPFDNM
ncbi:MAG: adenylate/guanylate cyclase domain-containing protein, partial [Rhizobiaceae bacterium]